MHNGGMQLLNESHIKRYNLMPVPPVEKNTEYFDVGVLRIGVEYRVLSDDIVAAARSRLATARGDDPGQTGDFDDRGVSIHVFALRDEKASEHLRFDCFEDDPHYHYISHDFKMNDVVGMDSFANGDHVQWALERIRSHLPGMLERARAGDIVPQIDYRALRDVLPRIAESASRLRFHHDEQRIKEAALAG